MAVTVRAAVALFVSFEDLQMLIVLCPSTPFFERMRRMIGEVEGGLVHVEDPLHVAMWTNEELMGLLNEGLCLLSHLGKRVKSTHSLQRNIRNYACT